MQKQLFRLIVIVAIGSSSCSTVKDSDLHSEMEQSDYLVYFINDHPDPQQLVLYSPTSNQRTQILSDWDIDEFSLSANNRLAFSSSRNGNSSIYVLEYPFTENTPREITLDKSSSNISPSWSPDGRPLLFDSVRTESKKLLLWDGKSFSSLYDHRGKISEVVWSNNGKLAFTEFFINDLPPDGDSSEVYIWDGNATVSVSQNPSGEDRFPAWSRDGKLAFFSSRNGENDVFIWDGISKINGVPDIHTFTNIAPGFTQYYSLPVWTSSNTLAFSGGGTGDSHVQIYEWDGQTAKNISQNPSANNGGQSWRSDGYWSFITFFSDSQDLYIRDNTNQTVLQTKGQYPPAWSQKKLLIFCVPGNPDWTLSMWNGKNVVEIAHGSFIAAKWKNGEHVFCSYG